MQCPSTAEPEPSWKPSPAQRLKTKTDYIKGVGSVRECALKHGVKPDTAYNWSVNENWLALRTAYMKRANDRLLAQTEIAGEETYEERPKLPPASTQAGKLAVVEEQLQAIDKLFSAATDPKDLVAIMKSKDLALNQWALLTGFPKPGTRRVPRQSSRHVQTSDPIPAEPDPAT